MVDIIGSESAESRLVILNDLADARSFRLSLEQHVYFIRLALKLVSSLLYQPMFILPIFDQVSSISTKAILNPVRLSLYSIVCYLLY